MTELMIRWNASHDRLNAATIARDEAFRASNPSRQQLTRAQEAYDAVVAAHYAILDELNAAQDAADRAEDAAAVAAAEAIIRAA